jgi:hypothetical protein
MRRVSVETCRQLDLGQVLFDLVCLLAGLRDFGPVDWSRLMYRAQRFERVRWRGRPAAQQPAKRRVLAMPPALRRLLSCVGRPAQSL